MFSKKIKTFGLFILVILIVIQFFPIDKSVPESSMSTDFITATNPPAEVANLVKSACYDCHSYQTKYPWYSNVAPASWWLADHIDDGRDELNFSTWTDYSPKKAAHKIKEAIELVGDEQEMPLPPYTWIHSEARLTDKQRKTLTDWFQTIREDIQARADTALNVAGDGKPTEDEEGH